MSLRLKKVLTLGAVLALGVGCDQGSSGSVSAAGGTGGTGGGTVVGTNPSGGSSSITAADDAPLFESTECWVPEQFQLASYQDGGLGGAAGSSSVDAGGAEPPSLQVGDGDLSVLVVFDKSGSMGEWWGDRTRFWAAHDALMRGVHHYIDNLTVSAILFPLETSCGVPNLTSERQIPWLQGHDFVQRWAADLCPNQPGGGTPLLLALEVADSTIQDAQTLGLLEERFRVLVLTDGEANCGATTDQLVAYPSQWASLGVETHVIGLPGSEAAADVLRRMAHAGGGVYTAVPAVVVNPVTGAEDPSAGQDVLTGALDLVVR